MPHADQDIGRRAFLARTGMLGAVVATGLVFPGFASATRQTPGAAEPDDVLAVLRPALAELSRDTFNGLIAMTCPGSDAYSRAQGTPRSEPGGIDARATDFLMHSLDKYVPAPDQVATPLSQSLATGLAGARTPLPQPLPDHSVHSLDEGLRTLLDNDESIPLSLLVAMLLNLVATEVNPAAVNGPFVSPFSRLSYRDKCRSFELMEGANADLVALLDAHLAQPLKASVSGVLKFLAGALLEFSAYGSYGEWGVFDPASRSLTARPVGWELVGYQPRGVVHNWDEFLGYYQDRRKVENI